MANAKATSRAGYYLYLIPGCTALILIVLVPLIANVFISLTAWKGIGTPRFIAFDNYVRLLSDTVFWGSFKHVGLFVIPMTILPIMLGLVLAAVLYDYVAVHFSERLSSFFRAGFYLPQILPLTAAGVLWSWILNPVGVVNAALKGLGLDFLAQNWLGDANYAIWAISAMIVWIQVGYCLVVFMSGLARIDPSLYEAAELDNATWFIRFRYITIPMLKPEIFVVALTTLIAALKMFAPVYVLTSGGPDNATTVPSFMSYYHFFTTNRVGYAAAIATLQTAATIIVGVFFLRVQSRQSEEA